MKIESTYHNGKVSKAMRNCMKTDSEYGKADVKDELSKPVQPKSYSELKTLLKQASVHSYRQPQ